MRTTDYHTPVGPSTLLTAGIDGRHPPAKKISSGPIDYSLTTPHRTPIDPNELANTGYRQYVHDSNEFVLPCPSTKFINDSYFYYLHDFVILATSSLLED